MTNDDKKEQDLKNVTAGQVPFPVDHSPGGGGQGSGGGVDPDPGVGRPADDLTAVTGGNVPFPVDHSPGGGGQGADPDPRPGPGVGVTDLEGTTAGASVVPGTGTGGRPDSTPDPAFDPPPSSIGGGADISQGGDSAGNTG